jgi:DNA polymerase-3 subunit delta'
VRLLTEWLYLSPVLGRRKVALIDPAGDLTENAANALLKTLEEPPPGRVVILVAPSPGSLPPTVRSRCQHVAFGALPDGEVAEVLRRAGWPAQAARQAAALAEGSPGVALARDGKAWRESADAVRAVLESGERGAALALAEGLGESRERVQLALQALLGLLREAARRRLGPAAGAEAPLPLRRLGTAEVGRLLESALETHRRLEGDRPPNAKLALSRLLLGCLPAPPAAAGGRGGRS